ncbi:MAG: type I phosphomannose isomerase catalytic subunit [Clostridia bacterium]
MLYPLLFKPIYKEFIWGGRNLETKYNRFLPDDTYIGESWELTSREEGISIIDNGHFKGKTLQEIFEEYASEIMGRRFVDCRNKFPLLIKIIDANNNLSVQVHPDGVDGKTEVWYVLAAEEGSKIVYGLNNGMSKESFIEAIDSNRVESVINEIVVKEGDIFYIPSGTVHSLGKGIIVLEVQQNSNTTYRIYDWNRMGLDGKPRQLHIEEALAVIDFNENCNIKSTMQQTQENNCNCQTLVECTHFIIEKLQVDGEYTGHLSGEKFEILISIDGDFEIVYGNREVVHVNAMQTVMLPAMLGDYTISRQCKLLKICTNS